MNEEYLDYLADNTARLDEMERQGLTEPQPSTPHVPLAAAVQGQYISQYEYDTLSAIAHRLGRTLAQHIRVTLSDHVEWWEATGEPKPETEQP